jgi:hypothetical protein
MTVSTDDVPQVVSLQVTPSGFEPRETIAPKGKFLILLQNRTGQRDLNFFWRVKTKDASPNRNLKIAIGKLTSNSLPARTSSAKPIILNGSRLFA